MMTTWRVHGRMTMSDASDGGKIRRKSAARLSDSSTASVRHESLVKLWLVVLVMSGQPLSRTSR